MLNSVDDRYQHACQLAAQGRHEEAIREYEELALAPDDSRLRALIQNDLGALNLVKGDLAAACRRFKAALSIDPHCAPARANLNLAIQDPAVSCEPTSVAAVALDAPPHDPPKVKVAIISFLLNWPSRGGGNIHTVELAHFLESAGFAVTLFYPRFSPWSIGQVDDTCPFRGVALDFQASDWNVDQIKARFRSAVDACRPDYVILTHSWNFKPHFADAMRGYRCLLRIQALECLCPLNNLRLVSDRDGRFRQCSTHQLEAPQHCFRCLRELGTTSGGLHRAERCG